MQNLKRFISLWLVIVLLLISCIPINSLEAKQKEFKSSKKEKGKVEKIEQNFNLKNLPAFPEDLERVATDWSEVDWSQEVVLPRDLEEFYKTKEELLELGKYAEAEALEPKKSRLSDKKNMERYHVPEEVQDLVIEYQKKTKNNLEHFEKLDSAGMDEKLKEELKLKIKTKGKNPQILREKFVENENVLVEKKFNKAEKQEIEIEEKDEEIPELDFSTRKIEQKLKKKEKKIKMDQIEFELSKEPFLKRIFEDDVEGDLREEMTLKKAKKELKKNERTSFLREFIVPQVKAVGGGETVLMEYYSGIEKHSLENILYYLSQKQNTNGSFGDFKEYELSAKIALSLSRFNKNESNQYALLLDYLENTAPQNNREKAMKARMLVGLEEPFADLMNALIAEQNMDGGLGLKNGYASDLETTLEFALALYVTQMGLENALPASLNYIVNQIQSDGTIYYDQKSTSSFFLINRALEILKVFQDLYWEENGEQITIQNKINQMLGFLNLRYADLLENGESVDQIMTLASFQDYAFEIEKQKELREFLKQKQSLNGSFANSFYTTVMAMQTLAQPDLVITAIQPSVLVNGNVLNFNITVLNQGYAPINQIQFTDFANQVIRTNTMNLEVDLNPQTEINFTVNKANTLDLLGNVDYEIFLETGDDFDFSNNWWKKTLVFANNSANTPALPANFMAQKATALSVESPVYPVPAISLHWTYIEDSNRQNYILMLRQQGETEWIYLPLDNNWNGVLVKGFDENYLQEDIFYEVNLAVLHSDGVTLTYDSEQIIQVKLSSVENEYLGTASGSLLSTNNSGAGLNVDSYLANQANVNAFGNFELLNLGNGLTSAWTKETQYEKLKTKFSVEPNGNTQDVRVFTHLKEDSIPPEITYFEPNSTTIFPFENQHEMEILFDVNDNVKVKETDFYLYHDSSDFWEYLGTKTDNTSFHWYVPADLIGTGYKLKAIAWDYQNNSSVVSEWGTFEIVDGTVPPDSDIPVITTFEPRYGTVTSIKNQLEFEMWLEASDNMELDRAELYLYKPTNASWEKIDEAIFSGNNLIFAWTPPLGLTGTDYKFKAIAWDTQNNQSLPQEWGPFEIIDGTELSGTLEILGMENGIWALDDTKVINWKIESPHAIEEISQIQLYYDGVHSHTLFQNYASGANGQVSYTMPLDSFYVSNNAYISVIACDVIANCVTLNSTAFQIVDNTPPPPAPWGIPQQVTGITIEELGLYRHFEHIQKNADGSVNVIYKEYEGFSWQPQGEYRRIVSRRLVNGFWESPVILKSYWYRDGQTDAKSYYIYDIEQTANTDLHLTYVISNHTAQTVSKVSYLHILNSSIDKDLEISGGAYEGFWAQVVITSTGKVCFAWREGDANNLYHIKYRELENNNLSPIERLMSHSYAYGITLDQDIPVIAYHDAGQIYLIRKDNGVWSSPIPINRREIKKTKLDQYTEDADKFSLIVEQDPEEETNYLWLSTIKTQSDLETVLTNNNFVKKTEILETWRLNEYATDALDYALFTKGNQEYDLFYRNYDGGRSLMYLNFSLDLQNAESSVHDYTQLVSRTGSENISDYRVLMNAEQKYHVFYNKEDLNSLRRIGHFILDENLEFNAYLSSLVMDVGDWLFASENNDELTVYYGGTIAGGTALLMNTADYSALLDSSLRIVAPQNNAHTSSSLLLSWTADENDFDNYDLELGLNPSSLEQIATNLQNTQYAQEGLIPNTTYYWRVVGHNTNGSFNSSVYSFQTTEENFAPTFQFLTPWSEENPAFERFNITWTDNDSEENAKIALYYDTDNSDYDGKLIVENIAENDTTDSHLWNTKKVKEGTYYIYAVVTDSVNEPFKVYSQGSVKISFPDCVSPASGEWHITQTCLLRENHIQANRIIVSSGAILMIDSGVMLELDSEDYEIKVEKGSLVKIFQGGKLKKTVVNQPPYFEFVTPTTEENLTSTGYTLSWLDNDFREDAVISLYYDTDKNGFDGTLIVGNLSEDSEIDEYFWDLSEVNDGIYFIYAVISDGVNSPVQVYSSGSISTFQNICTPPTSGDWTLTESCTLLENTDISANVFVQSGAVLTIESGATLDLDFLNYQFYGEEHSFLNVKEGGSME